MPRATPIQTTFNAGELSYSIEGRVDTAKYPNGCKTLENYIPMIQGPAKRRGGTRFVAEVKNSSARTWLVKFQFSATQSYQLEFGNLYIRFFTQHGQLLSGGVPYEVVSPYTTADLINSDGGFALGFCGSNDVVYLSHQNYALRKLSRISAVSWTLTAVNITNGPFKTINTTATTVTAAAITGVTTITASAAIFSASMVGSLFYIQQPLTTTTAQWQPGVAVALNDLRRSGGITYKAANAATTGTIKPIHFDGTISDGVVNWVYQDPGYGYGTITGFTSTTVVELTVVNQLPSNATSATTKWAFGEFSAVNGYPSQVDFYKERLALARGTQAWLSVSADYENFSSRDQGGNVVTDQAISITLQSEQSNAIQWLSSGDSLLCGTAGGEFSVQAITTNLAFGADNVTAPSISTFGCRGVRPVRIASAVLFIQRAGTKLRDLMYDFLSNNFDSKDNSILADHITLGGITQMAFQQEPYSIVWNLRADGQLAGMTYSREQYQDAPYGGWHKHRIGGIYNDTFFDLAAVVECISVTPDPNGGRDELWMIVKRTINGVTRRYVEYMEKERTYNDDPQDSFYVDCGATLDRSAYNLVYAVAGSVANAEACVLIPDAGALIAGTTSVLFTAGHVIFSSGDVGRYIRYRYSTIDTIDNKTLVWHTASALITSYLSTITVRATIVTAWPHLFSLPKFWRLTTLVVTGLSYLEGRTVSILADGAVVAPSVVTGGQITLPYACGKAQIGLSFASRLQTMRFNAGAADGTSQGKTSRINKLIIRLFESLGVTYGSNFDKLKEIPFREASDLMDEAPPLYTGDKVLDFTADYSGDPWVCIEQTEPLPATIVCLIPVMSTQDRS